MKKLLFENRFLLFLLLAVWIIGLSSCKSTQQTTQTTEKQFVTINDTIYIVKNQKITDTIFVSVPKVKTIKPECDSLINSELQNQLKRLQTKKKSGNNEYGFYYDAYKNVLVAYAQLDSTFTEYKSKHTDNQSTKTETKTIYKTEKYVPFWVEILAWIGALSLAYFGFKIKFKG
ncbi:hypothetical protein CGC54_10010 [Capnocytophaga canimorsus]|uniref:Lipoprotein n=1 Tax=Capnocytophaga canimorsus TaxID=28188 RepID=A0AAC9Z4F4_9FLAO|nr:hypothetical protein [Capnocytophaga canimorsus]ATA94639.1 hypothetical protein CGC54_10010 [Capnocytophaga canimorsus]